MILIKKRREIYKDVLRVLLRSRGDCNTIAGIAREIGIDISNKNRLYSLYDTLSNLKRSGLITSRWVMVSNKEGRWVRVKLYCLNREEPPKPPPPKPKPTKPPKEEEDEEEVVEELDDEDWDEDEEESMIITF